MLDHGNFHLFRYHSAIIYWRVTFEIFTVNINVASYIEPWLQFYLNAFDLLWMYWVSLEMIAEDVVFCFDSSRRMLIVESSNMPHADE